MNEGSSHPSRPATILIVDDMPANLQLLVHFLRSEGYRVRPVTSGAAALELVTHIRPDLVLMDVSMPEMDGFETCRRLKERPEMADVPIVFLSALGDLLDKVRAFEVGGVDYITKPFHMEEVRIRIMTHLRLATLRRDLEEKCRQLQQLETIKEQLVHLLIHDLRTPLSNITAALDLLVGGATADQEKPLAAAREAVFVLEHMIADILDVYKMEIGAKLVNLKECSGAEVVAQALKMAGTLLARHRFERPEVPPEWRVVCDPALTERVLMNLLHNAVKHTAPGTLIRLRVEDRDDVLRFSIQDQCAGLSPEDERRLFEKFGRLESVSAGTGRNASGLGLVFSRMVIEAQGGEIGVRNRPGSGCEFWFTVLKPQPLSSSALP